MVACDTFDTMVAEADAQMDRDYADAFPFGECNCGCALESDGTCIECIEREVRLDRLGRWCKQHPDVVLEPEEVALVMG